MKTLRFQSNYVTKSNLRFYYQTSKTFCHSSKKQVLKKPTLFKGINKNLWFVHLEMSTMGKGDNYER